MIIPFRLIFKNMFASRLVALRTLLTLGALMLATLLVCVLRTMVVGLSSGVEAAASNRLVVQSAVSLFVDLPLSYQGKIDQVPGVGGSTKFTWFGAYYREPGNFFAQFGVDHDRFFDVYPEIELVSGKAEDFQAQRTSCLIGTALSQRFGWKVGDTVPLIGTIYPRTDGSAWEFTVAGVYRSKSANVDSQTLFFRHDYLEETLKSGGARGPLGAGVYTVSLAPGASLERVQQAIDTLFENGPQRVQATTEAEFQRQFVTMMGGIPQLLGSIGGGVVFAILLAVINTMLMAGRERTQDLGVLKALGFTDGTAFALLALESLLVCGLGGALGVGLALASAPVLGVFMERMMPTFDITRETMALGMGLALGIGIIAGALPAWRASRLRCVDALRAEG